MCGQEALRAAREGRGVLLDNLIIEAMMSCRGEEHPLGGDPKELLALFIRRSLRLVSTDCTPENISRIVFTLPDLHPGIISVMEEVIRLLGFRRAGQPPGLSGKLLLLCHSSEAGAAGVSCGAVSL